ncbi:hypothetical protein [Pseudomonas serbica]|uniref:hypothetical protein n=1 Tax=Pseudomonas serbica TaxID=2965074 RepID=UPI00237AD386|nr:hypothetical protein [Pseudomonas serbica]
MNDQPEYAMKMDVRIAALSQLPSNQIDPILKDLLADVHTLVQFGLIDQAGKEQMTQKAHKAATTRKIEIEVENVARLAFQVIALSSLSVGAFLWATYANYLSQQNAVLFVFFAGIALVIYGLGFLATRAIHSLWRKLTSCKKPR